MKRVGFTSRTCSDTSSSGSGASDSVSGSGDSRPDGSDASGSAYVEMILEQAVLEQAVLEQAVLEQAVLEQAVLTMKQEFLALKEAVELKKISFTKKRSNSLMNKIFENIGS